MNVNQACTQTGVDKTNLFRESEYTDLANKTGELLTKGSILNLVSDGKYSEGVGRVFEAKSKYSIFNAGLNAGKDCVKGEGLFKDNGYTDTVGKTAGLLTKFSLANILTGGKYSEAVQNVASARAKFSPISLIKNLFS